MIPVNHLEISLPNRWSINIRCFEIVLGNVLFPVEHISRVIVIRRIKTEATATNIKINKTEFDK